MTSHPPSGKPSIPPTGPPAGPLSGPSTHPGQATPPPAEPPRDGSGGGPGGGSGGGSGGGAGGGGSGGAGGGGDGSGEGSGGGTGGGGAGGGPWWRSVPKVASLTAVLVAAIALVVVLTRSDGGGDNEADTAGGEVFLQNTSATGPDPFTRSTARSAAAPVSPVPLPSRTGADADRALTVSGSTPGLYGGTHRVASCDVEQQIRFLSEEPAKNAAFAKVLGLATEEVPGYLRSLTPLQLRVDTRVTNHGFRDGSPVPYQSVLQAGTAVMVDDRGVPRVRCACGNPLTPAVAQQSAKPVGTAWPGYRTSNLVVVKPSVTVVDIFVIYDPRTDRWTARQSGDTGRHDQHTTPPPPPTISPPASPSTSPPTSPPTSPTTPVPCVTITGTETPTPSDGVTPPPCPSTTTPSPSTSTPSPGDSTPGDGTPSDSSASADTAPEGAGTSGSAELSEPQPMG
ncbi:DUF6777 domain-containing protein [Streptomyces sp. NPDC085481]|uniref:DUF6777 domain-containing protein n=1 Tax=Streptomyces sp. NPDC085481 TaxID=3365727 RepID=UPI0037CFC55D